MLLSYNELLQLVKQDVITAPLSNINGASIDITLDGGFMLEDPSRDTINLAKKETPTLIHFDTDYMVLRPKEFCLASSAEVFNLPNGIAAEYKLKSSLARSGLQHMLAGWCDPTWNNSKLTLEFTNVLQFHSLRLEKGMKIGQMVFYRCEPVPEEVSYSVKGQYNRQVGVTKSKGAR